MADTRQKVTDLTTVATAQNADLLELTVRLSAGVYQSRKITVASFVEIVEQLTRANKGYFDTEADLVATYPAGEGGWYAIVGDTDTVWIWDVTTSAWVDSGNGGVVLSVNGLTGTVVLTASDIGYTTTVGLTATNTRDAIDELKTYVDSQISGTPSGLFINQIRKGSESVVAGSNTITFDEPFSDNDYTLLIDGGTAEGVDKENITYLSSGFEINALSAGDIVYFAVKNTPTSTTFTDSDAIHDNIAAEISAITEKASPVSNDWILIEDSEDSDNKKKLRVGNLPTSSGTVTSVGITGSNGIEIDSGSPVTTSGNIALGINAATLRTHINVEDGADVTDTDNVNAVATQVISIACSDETTDLSVGTSTVTFRMPFAMTLTAVKASVTTAPVGSGITVDINESGSTILSTKITIDAGEKTSTTAATPPVISDSSLADDAEMTVDIDAVGSTTAGAGLKIYIIGTKS